MKIADFFISLGFDIKGAPDVENTDKSVQNLEKNSLRLLAGVTALNAAFYGMMAVAVEAGVVLQKFAVNTGLSSEELQRWQFRAEKANVAGRDVSSAIDAIQKARVSIAFGGSEALAPWALLGIDPRQNPFKVLEQLRVAVINLDPAIARFKLQEMGFGSDMLYFLKQIGPDGLGKSLTVSPAEVEALANLSGQWRAFLFTLGNLATRFAAQFKDEFTVVLTFLSKGVELGGKFIDWLEKGGFWADSVKEGLTGMVAAMTALAGILAVLMTGPFGAFALAIGLIVGPLAAVVLLLQDFMVAAQGGKSALDWNDGLIFTIKNVERLAHAIEYVIDKWDQLRAAFKSGAGGVGFDILSAAATIPSYLAGHGGGGVVTQTNNITQHINGAQSPSATGREVGRSTTRQISDAFKIMPVPAH